MPHAYSMSAADTGLLIIDLQEKLLPLVPRRDALLRDVTFLVRAAKLLDITTVATEQYPRGLGPTAPGLAALLPACHDKTAFSCAAVPAVMETFHREARPKIVLAGMETHVCVLQTALDLLAHDFRVFVPVDGVAARHDIDHDTALRRLEKAGATLTTVEGCVFEWIGGASHPRFKDVSRLVQDRMKLL